MKINEKILSIPPYISTTWKNISALHMKEMELIITLTSGDSLVVPELKKEVVDTIFMSHALYLDRHHAQEPSLPIGAQLMNVNPSYPNLFEMDLEGTDFPFKLGEGSIDSLDAIGSISQHNPAQSNLPELPPEILNKIVAITQIVAPDEPITIPKPELHCNCVHCQISRAIHGMPQAESVHVLEKIEEPVTEEDLTFRQWDICQTGNKLYTVINRLDTKEKYSVYLGQPLGCTCGKHNCEHLLAVLKS